MSSQNLSNLLTEYFYPVAIEVLNNLNMQEIVDLFHASKKFESITTDLLKRRKDDKDWMYIHGTFNDVFLREFHGQLGWKKVYSQKLSESFIREFSHVVDWKEISWSQRLSEDFIIEFQDKVDWDIISLQQTLSENFIRRFYDKLNWDHISSHQELSEDFMKEFKQKISWQAIKKRFTSVFDFSIDFMFEFQLHMGDNYNYKQGLKRKFEEDE